jgi:hypothetical protein
MTTSEVTIEMDDQPDHLSDAFAFFGATGDLAYKKIFPALHNMVRQGTLKVPVIGIANRDGALISYGSELATASKNSAGALMKPAFWRAVQNEHSWVGLVCSHCCHNCQFPVIRDSSILVLEIGGMKCNVTADYRWRVF